MGYTDQFLLFLKMLISKGVFGLFPEYYWLHVIFGL